MIRDSSLKSSQNERNKKVVKVVEKEKQEYIVLSAEILVFKGIIQHALKRKTKSCVKQ